MNRCTLTCLSAAAAGGILAGSCFAGDPELTVVEVADGFTNPLLVTHAPGDTERIFVVNQSGTIYTVDLATGDEFLFMDISDEITSGGERGLLGLAFHPDHFQNGLFYVNYTASSPFGDTVVAEYSVRTLKGGEFDFSRGDATSEERMITIDQPFGNHNGGWIGFAPGTDEGNYLYVAMGDGGSGNDPSENAQDITNNLLGKMLRLDVDTDDFPDDDSRNYGIPASNPFVDVTGDDEIWAFGLRNPWRPSFDRETGDMLIADVGQNAEEEVSFEPVHVAGTLPGDDGYNGGLNYGWDCMEGNNCIEFDTGCDCDDDDLVPPIHTYTHSQGCSITGGYLYRGCAIPGLEGTYFFADLCSSQIWSFETDGETISNFENRTSELSPPGGETIGSFGEDAFGEIYICDLSGGEIYRIVAENPPPDSDGDGIPDPCEPPVECPGDANGDLVVDSEDLNAVLGSFGTDDPAGDTDGDGDVDSDDLNDVLGNFGVKCE